jgi:hypothetical protein
VQTREVYTIGGTESSPEPGVVVGSAQRSRPDACRDSHAVVWSTNKAWVFRPLSILRKSRVRRRATTNAPLLIAGAAVNFLFLIVLMAFSYLREEPIFWTNAGDWPVWLREMVQSSYYPLMFLEFLLLTVFSGVSIQLLSTRAQSASLSVILLPILWGLLFVVIANSIANNLDNLWNGRPLHWHPDSNWSQI